MIEHRFEGSLAESYESDGVLHVCLFADRREREYARKNKLRIVVMDKREWDAVRRGGVVALAHYRLTGEVPQQ